MQKIEIQVEQYYRYDVKYETLLTKKIISNCWCVAIEIKEKMYKDTIMVVYHSPSASHADFVSFLEDIVEKLTIKRDCMILGDFNIDFMIDSFYTKKLQNLMSRYETVC